MATVVVVVSVVVGFALASLGGGTESHVVSVAATTTTAVAPSPSPVIQAPVRSGGLSAAVRFANSTVHRSEREAFAVVELKGEESAGQRQPVAAAIVIDASSSMRGNKIANARAAAQKLVAGLSDGDVVAIISFSDGAVLHDIATVGPRTSERTRAAIASVAAGGYTCISCGLEEAYRTLAASSEDHTQRVILLSDGQANRGTPSASGLAAVAAAGFKRGISTSSVGVGRGFDGDVSRAIAASGAGNFYFAYNSKVLAQIVDRELGQLGKLVARRIKLTITAGDGMTLGELTAPGATQNGKVATVTPPALAAGDVRHIAVPIALMGRAVTPNLTVAVEFEDPRHGARRVTAVGSIARSTNANVIAVSTDPVATAFRARFKSARALEQALSHYQVGRSEEAVKLATREAARLEKLALVIGREHLADDITELELAAKNFAKYELGTNGAIMTTRVNSARVFEITGGSNRLYMSGTEGNAGLYRESDLE